MGGIGVRDDENKQKIRAKIRRRGTQKSPLKIELRQGRRGLGITLLGCAWQDVLQHGSQVHAICCEPWLSGHGRMVKCNLQ